MELYWRLFFTNPPFFRLFLWRTPAFSASTKTVIAEGSICHGRGDTIAGAEEKVLQRAQRNAVEKTGVYLETTFHDVEKESGGRSTQTSSLEIRTIAAAITETEILESRCSFELNRPVFFVRIRATFNVWWRRYADFNPISISPNTFATPAGKSPIALATARASTAADRRSNVRNRSERKARITPTGERDARDCSPHIEPAGQDPAQHRRRPP
ncbi:MAG: hypothetical protein ABI988_13325 [Nitrospirota bacterium]